MLLTGPCYKDYYKVLNKSIQTFRKRFIFNQSQPFKLNYTTNQLLLVIFPIVVYKKHWPWSVKLSHFKDTYSIHHLTIITTSVIFFNVPIVCIWNMVIRSWSMAMMCGGGCWSPIVYTKLRLQLIVCLLQNQYTTHLNKYLSDRNSVYGRRGIWRTTNTAYYLFKKIKYVCSFYYRNNLLLIWFDLYPNSLIDWGFAKGKG